MDQFKIRQINGDLGQVNAPKPQTVSADTGRFKELLNVSIANQAEVKFSSHAMDRLNSRNIMLSGNDIIKLNEAVREADSKGSRDSLIIMNDLAFVVSIKNKTVVTAMTNDQMNNKVITNIDSTVLA
ncbi:TIGR02530 family flagellar biosynthesis protein [candidate division KSB1 bacterium]